MHDPREHAGRQDARRRDGRRHDGRNRAAEDSISLSHVVLSTPPGSLRSGQVVRAVVAACLTVAGAALGAAQIMGLPALTAQTALAAAPPAPAQAQTQAQEQTQAPAQMPAQAPAYRESIAGTTVTFEMVPVPGGTVTIEGARVTIAPFHAGRTEVTWDLYDVFALSLDQAATPPAGSAAGADAIARPSSPYGAPDYGWGHAGFPVISVTRTAAEAFAKWLSQKTGRAYRLPSEAEWVHMATLAAGAGGLTAGGPRTEAVQREVDALAWHRDNASARTHPVATKRADQLGLFDVFGNASEWVMTSNGSLVARGGSFRDAPAAIGVLSRSVQDDTWNERDPQLPKSRWWLSDAPFVGIRLIATRIP